MKYFYLTFILICWLTACDKPTYLSSEGTALGTNYSIVYSVGESDSDMNIHDAFSLLDDFGKSLSVYDDQSHISRINRNEATLADDYFLTVFAKSKEIYASTSGAFDPSGEPLFKAWGFSFADKKPVDAHMVDSLKQYVGMDKIKLDGRKVLKANPNVVLNFNAIAKGYAVDLLADWLDRQGIENYMVEIGGEIMTKGINKEGKAWRIGIDHPSDGNFIPGKQIDMVLAVTNKAVATSGNYRRFYVNDKGEKISHTIDPVTGYPVTHNLLSVTVIADDAMTADAYATAFMVMGVDKSKELLERLDRIEAVFIYQEEGKFMIDATEGVAKYAADNP